MRHPGRTTVAAVLRTAALSAALSGTLAVALSAALWAALWAVAPAPAWAHIGPLTLTVAGDGATGVTVTAVHQDGHPVEAAVPMELTASGGDGRTVGPVTLLPAGEGLGFYSSGPLLTPGRWVVRVTTPDPTPGTASTTVEAFAAAPAPTPAAPTAPPGDPDSGIGTGTALWAAAAITALAAAAAYLALRRPTRPHRRPA